MARSPMAKLRVLSPASVSVLAADLVRRSGDEHATGTHLRAAIDWLCAAQDAGGGGVAATYSLLYGWFPPYPETTGYIIPTFYDYARLAGREELRERAARMAEWELTLQHPAGYIPCGVHGDDPSGVYSGERAGQPSVFNTGQVLFGWCRAYEETSDRRFLDAAVRAARWIVDSQDPDGAWRRNLSPAATAPLRAYKARVAWALAEAYRVSGDVSFAVAAERSLDWTLAQQLPNGFIQNASFYPERDPWTHTIAYCVEGLLEGGELLGRADHVEAARRTLDALMRRFEITGRMAGTFDARWRETATYECLTGSAQIARCWLRMYQRTSDPRYLSAALKLNRRVKRTQVLGGGAPGIVGGIKGSYPIWGSRRGGYTRLAFPNWAAKFFVDSLLLEEQLMAPLEEREVAAC